MLAVVVADVEGEGEHQFEGRQFGTIPDYLRLRIGMVRRAGGRGGAEG
jgi:hypothetical protein